MFSYEKIRYVVFSGYPFVSVFNSLPDPTGGDMPGNNPIMGVLCFCQKVLALLYVH